MKRHLVVAITFIASLCYGALTLLSSSSFFDNWAAALFSLFCLGLFFLLARDILSTTNVDSENPFKDSKFWIGLSAAIHLGIITSFWLMDAPDDRLWVFDSYNLHVPSASNIADMLAGEAPLRELKNSFDRIYLSQIFVGLFFFIFGKTPVASALALLFAKLATIKVLFDFARAHSGDRIANIATAAYVLLPTITFYTTVFYKEAFIHLFIVSLMYLCLLIYRHGVNPARGILALALIVALGNERFYLAPLLLISLSWATLSYHRPKASVVFGLLTVGALGAVGFIWHFSDQINFRNIFSEISRFKGEYNAFSDVDKKWNADLLYPLGVIKLYFSPYFHPRKFELFSDFSLVINWGSFMSQMILLGGAFEVLRRIWRERIAFIRTDGPLLLPLVGFLIVFGYVAPFAGRLRDAFIPLIAIYFASLLGSMWNRQPAGQKSQ